MDDKTKVKALTEVLNDTYAAAKMYEYLYTRQLSKSSELKKENQKLLIELSNIAGLLQQKGILFESEIIVSNYTASQK